MIGVIAYSPQFAAVREFFELFKTPWEWAEKGREYDVLLCTADAELGDYSASLLLLYSGRQLRFDREANVIGSDEKCGRILGREHDCMPVYGETRTFPDGVASVLRDAESGDAVLHECRFRNTGVVRIGYDLFVEIQHLLATGQSSQYAGIPTLELHIDLLRSLILRAGIPVIEIPPVPAGYQSITCLTHDVDHPSIRRHKADHTVIGLMYRAVAGSFVNMLQGRMRFQDVLTNWTAALKLPLIYLGFATDFWADFAEQYLEAEGGIRSTYFVIPFAGDAGHAGHAGQPPQGPAPRYRAACYGARDIAGSIKTLTAAGCEVGLHGLDAWRDSAKAAGEFEEIRRLTGAAEMGTRMHWLYYDDDSPAVLERAGASYDSTIGYRETVGYRAGTSQAYKPLNAERLLELPLHVMDTALFYPAYMGLSAPEATTVLQRFADDLARFGGCLTLNWHDRSLAPERLWIRCYRDLLHDLRSRKTWFATCGQAVRWFCRRRSVVFTDRGDTQGVLVTAASRDDEPDLIVRTHAPIRGNVTHASGEAQCVDMVLNGKIEIDLGARQTS